jgi:hypothetical protein
MRVDYFMRLVSGWLFHESEGESESEGKVRGKDRKG